MALALCFDNLWKSYAAGVAGCSVRVWALRGCALELQVGERIGIVGAAGAGKTTLVQCINGARRPDAGRIALLHPVTFIDHDASLPPFGSATTCIIMSRDVARIRPCVDRVVMLRDGHLVPMNHVGARRVAEPVR